MNSPKSTLLHLPTEILINILSDLEPKSLVTSVQTCRKFKQIYDDSSRLQYIAELEIAGMKDNPYCNMTVVDRLERLREREDRWAALQPDFLANIPIPRPPSSIYDVTPNVYLLGVAVSPDLPLTAGIQSMRLPSSVNDTATPFLELKMTKHIIDFGTSIEEHDLLAVLTMIVDNSSHATHGFLLEVALLRHSNGEVHDEAQQAVLPVMGVNDIVSVSIEISGENLAITVVSYTEEGTTGNLVVLNWKKGTRKGATRPAHNLGLVFLREDLLLFPDTHDNTLNIYYIPHSQPGVDDSTLDMKPVAQLALPGLAPNHQIVSLQCRCDPSPTAGGEFPRYNPADRPFANDPKYAIMILEMRILGENHAEAGSAFAMFVHRYSLLNILPEGWEERVVSASTAGGVEASSGPSNDPRGRPLAPLIENDAAVAVVAEETSGLAIEDGSDDGSFEDARSRHGHQDIHRIPWSEWGPKHTRWLDADKFSSVYITSTAGQRFVCIDKAARSTPSPIKIIDFNQHHVRTATLGSDQPALEKIVGLEQDVGEGFCDGKGVFAEERLESGLPYLELSTRTKHDFNAVLLDEQRILGIRNANGEEWSVVKQVELMHYG